MKDEQALSPSPNNGKMLSENRAIMLSARSENYKAPQLRAMDNKLKHIIHEKKNRLMNRVSNYQKLNLQ